MEHKLLIVEDDAFLGDILEKKFVQEGFSVHLVRDGGLAIGEIEKFMPGLILLDIVLPGKNGYQILETKLKREKIKAIPVLVISNSGQPVEVDRLHALGVSDCIIKSQFDPSDVSEKVKALFKQFEVGNSGQSSGGQKSRKILWVEDDKFLIDIIARKLSSAEFALTIAGDGEHAFKMLETDTPDIILLDISLPGMTGFEILKKLKETSATKDIPVLLLSNLGQKEDFDHGKTLGAEKFLVKATLTPEEILNEIRMVLKKRSK